MNRCRSNGCFERSTGSGVCFPGLRKDRCGSYLSAGAAGYRCHGRDARDTESLPPNVWGTCHNAFQQVELDARTSPRHNPTAPIALIVEGIFHAIACEAA
jgi:hypothetical protein